VTEFRENHEALLMIHGHILESTEVLGALPAEDILKAARLVIETLRAGGKIMLCGNGGSAADAQHIAAELMGRYMTDRAPLAAIALTTDTSALTAIANDYKFEEVFARQIWGIGRAGDCLIAISTSGNSANIGEAMETCKNLGIKVIGLTGGWYTLGDAKWKKDVGAWFEQHCTVCIKVPSTSTPIIQQCHITIGHIICGLVEAEFTKE